MSITEFRVNKRKMKSILKHRHCAGLYVQDNKDGTADLICFARTHGGRHILIARVKVNLK